MLWPLTHPNIQTVWVLYGQAARPISTGKLSTLLYVYIPPINVVVFDEP